VLTSCWPAVRSAFVLKALSVASPKQGQEQAEPYIVGAGLAPIESNTCVKHRSDEWSGYHSRATTRVAPTMDEPDKPIRGIVGARLVLALPECRFVQRMRTESGMPHEARLVLALPECRFIFPSLISRWSTWLESMGRMMRGKVCLYRILSGGQVGPLWSPEHF
jgi:hypothetical protein